MDMLPKNDRQTTIFYDSNSKQGRECYATCKAIKSDILNIDISKTTVNKTTWAKLAKMLDADVQQLINQDHTIFKGIYGNNKVDLDERDALKILEKNPEVITFPIAIRGKKAIQVRQSNDLRKLMKPDSKGINHP